MPFTENLEQFFRPEDFAHVGTWSEGSQAVNGILDNEYAEPFNQVSSSRPIWFCPTASMPTAAEGQTLTIGAVVYRIRSVEPDGLGISTIRLTKE